MARTRPAWLKALGSKEPPATIHIAEDEYQLDHVFKHDSWAATASYRKAHGRPERIVCKFNRIQPILGLPMTWLGRWLARREAEALHRLSDLMGIPAPMGPIFVEGRPAPHAAAHAFIPGEPLRPNHDVNDSFFPTLVRLLERLHRRGYAYVDLHKRENILVDDRGRPWLIDFQVHFSLACPALARWPILHRVLRALQVGDLYHLAKHVHRLRPDQTDVLARLHSERPAWIQLHRVVAVPLRRFRRGLLTLLGVRSGQGRATSEVFPEEAVRLALPEPASQETTPRRAA